MSSINQQLQIGVPNRNVNVVNRYARGLRSFQPQLGTEDPALDFYNDTQEIDQVLYGVNSNRDVNLGSDWASMQGERDIAEEMYEATEEYNNAGGLLGLGYPACVKQDCKTCKGDCKNTKGLKWLKGGKDCYKECRARLDTEREERIAAMGTPSAVGGNLAAQPQQRMVEEGADEGGGSGTTIALVVGGIVVLGIVGFIIMRKK